MKISADYRTAQMEEEKGNGAFSGPGISGIRHKKEKKGEETTKGIIKASDLHLFPGKNAESIKERYQKKATYRLLTQFAADDEINETMNALADKNVEKEAEAASCRSRILELEERKKQQQEMYDEDPDSRYQENIQNIQQEIDNYRDQEDQAKKEAYVSRVYLNGIKQELLKEHGMTDAVKDAEEIMESGRKAVIGQLMEEAKEYLDKKAAEEKEKKEKMEEEQEKLEELREKQKESREEKEEKLLDDAIEGTLELTRLQKKIVENLESGNLQEIVIDLTLEQREKVKGVTIDDLV